MSKIKFTKMVASGNDFVVIEACRALCALRYASLAKIICDRKYGIGADGLLILEKSKIADVKMRIFNADGSEAQMCGNGARCVALWSSAKVGKARKQAKLNIQTKAGIINSEVNKDNIKIQLTDPQHIKLDIPIKVNNRILKVNFINTGVPHTVIFVESIDKIDVFNIGRQVRYHKKFSPAGTNVDFVEILNNDTIKLRTYERGVEDETLACGTGSVASAIIATGKWFDKLTIPRIIPSEVEGLANWPTGQHKIKVYTRGGEMLRVYFNNYNRKIENVWLEGRAGIACKGEYYV